MEDHNCAGGGELSRTRLLIGGEATARLMAARVIVLGVGGVGSWCAEALVRSGVRHLTIADPDRVCPSNINRQLMAMSSTVDRPKVEVFRRRLLDISPEAEIEARFEAFNTATAESFRLGSYDFIIDAIDSIADKMLLIRTACRTDATLLSSMGAARKLDPSRIRTAEFWKVEGCPLARKLRQEFKRQGDLPAKKFRCVYSDELLSNRSMPGEPRANGSMLHITGIFGFTLAGMVINDMTLPDPPEGMENGGKGRG